MQIKKVNHVDRIEAKLIQDVLHVAHLTELPPAKCRGREIWIKAIAKFKLSNGNIGYGIVERYADLSYRTLYINGDTSAIVKMEEVYPFESLNKDYIKKFPKESGEKERIEYLKSLNLPYSLNYEEMSLDDLNKEVVKAAVFQQLAAMEE